MPVSPLFDLTQQRAAVRGSPGKICYAIGDVHGRLDLLDLLLSKIAQHRSRYRGKQAHVVLLGDIVDRGPDSRGVVERVRQPLAFDASLHVIKGNHEEMLVDVLRGAQHRQKSWFGAGGYECLRSYGVEVGLLFGQAPSTIERTLTANIPTSDVMFLDGLPDYVRFGDYLLVHAGVRPGRRLEDQDATDLRWIRAPFLQSDARHGAVIVHGHSVSLDVERYPNRIGIDTGAWKTGVLTALWIDDDRTGLIQAVGPASHATELF